MFVNKLCLGTLVLDFCEKLKENGKKTTQTINNYKVWKTKQKALFAIAWNQGLLKTLHIL